MHFTRKPFRAPPAGKEVCGQTAGHFCEDYSTSPSEVTQVMVGRGYPLTRQVRSTIVS